MESIYYVIAWHCHRRCRHCYEERFRPYVRGALHEVVAQAQADSPRIIDNLPERMLYRDLEDETVDGRFREKTGRIILSGGDVLTDPIREAVLYPVIERLVAKYRDVGGVNVVVQTTGDLVTPRIIDELLARGVWMISMAGMDDYHVGMHGERKLVLQERLVRMLEAAGMRRSGLQSTERKWHEEDGPLYSFFGATPDSWIGKLWPRGRAWANDLSTATLADNFCNRWSGGLNFLQHGLSGSEVSVDPDGNVFPCCLKTKAPLGSLVEEKLIDILDSLLGHPALEAISMGHPERMGLAHGWDVDTFIERSATVTPGGRRYRNLCIGCDRFHEEVLGKVLHDLRESRLAVGCSPRVAGA